MKVRKNSEQRNVQLDKEFYTEAEIKGMLKFHNIFYFDKNLHECYEEPEWYEFKDTDFRLFLENMESIQVEYNVEFGLYVTTTTSKSGYKYFVKL